ncbi:transposase zinc-binding domain-containing protein (plasmid) [Serratia ureilytica]
MRATAGRPTPPGKPRGATRPSARCCNALVQAHYPDPPSRVLAEDRPPPEYVREEFETYLRCGVLEHGFLRVVCEHCRAERLVAYSCRSAGCARAAAHGAWPSRRGIWWTRCSARGRCGTGAEFPVPVALLFASKPEAIGPVLGIVHRVIAGWLAGSGRRAAGYGAMRRGDPDPALRQRAESQHPLPHAVARRRVRGHHRASAAQAAPAPHPCAHIGATDGTGQHHRASRVPAPPPRRGWLEAKTNPCSVRQRGATTAWMGCG